MKRLHIKCKLILDIFRNYGENYGFKEYKSITAQTERLKSEFVRKFLFLGGFFGLIVYLRLNRG
jgi:hypothetical protein